MNKHLYAKMAVTNIRKNGKLYLPYLLTTIGGIMFYYILTSLGTNPHLYNRTTHAEAFKGATQLVIIVQSGSFVASVFVFIFLIYANSFILKHQKKQFGLYRVLGMERRHIVRIISIEVLLIFSIGLIGSLFFGILFDKLMLVLLFKIVGQTPFTGFYLNTNAISQTITLTVSIAVLILLRSIFSTLSAKDIVLLKSENTGEQEPKKRPVLTLIGLILLFMGYSIALKSTSAGMAINNFLPAALLVMLATYALFTAGSISVLKLLKKNKKYYYTTKHFVSVSGLLYRMKQNAAGLATICILSTAAIVVLSAAMSLYTNGERSINEQFPRTIQYVLENADKDTAAQLLESSLSEKAFPAEDIVTCSYGSGVFSKTENGIEPLNGSVFTGFDKIPDTYILTLAEYNQFNNTSETLQDTEILLYASDSFYTGETLTYLDTTYQIKGTADNSCLDYISNQTMTLFSKLLIVVPNEEVYHKFVSENDSFTYTGFNSSQTTEDIVAFANDLTNIFAANNLSFALSVKQLEQEYFYSMYGGILFVGITLGLLFILCTVMMIYYKQISEGYEDRERFLIMQKVGLSKEEIQKSIHSQIMLVFFLPLVTAVLHSAVALKIVASCLRMVIVVHMPTFILSVGFTCILFSLVYGIVYKITSKAYYNIVNE